MRRQALTTALLTCTACSMLSATASANLLIDGSFESSPPAANNAARLAIGSTAMLGWTVVNNNGSTTDNGNNILWIGNGGYGLSTPFGNDFLDLTGDSDRAPYDGVTQLVSTLVGQAYSLSFYLGAQGSGGSFGGPIAATASAGPAAGGAVTSITFTDPGTTGVTSNTTVWTLETLNFVATSANSAITIVGTSGSAFLGLDSVDLEQSTAVPEPGTWLLVLTGAVALSAARLHRLLTRFRRSIS